MLFSFAFYKIVRKKGNNEKIYIETSFTRNCVVRVVCMVSKQRRKNVV